MSLREAVKEFCHDNAPQLLKAPDVARILAIGRTKVYEMLAAGHLPVVKIGTAVRVPCRRLLEWIESKTEAARLN